MVLLIQILWVLWGLTYDHHLSRSTFFKIVVDFTISALSRNIQIISHKSIACFCPIHPYQFYFCAFWYISWDVFHIGFSLTSSIAFLFRNSIAIHQHCLLQFHSININTFIKYRLLAIFFWLRQCMERCLDACIVYGKLNGEWRMVCTSREKWDRWESIDFGLSSNSMSVKIVFAHPASTCLFHRQSFGRSWDFFSLMQFIVLSISFYSAVKIAMHL